MRIEAAVLRHHDVPFEIETVELADPTGGQLRVRIAGVGFCHTDVLPRDPSFLARPPIVVGHEGAGVVEEVGAGVTGIEVGDHVLLSFDSCGLCENCAGGHPAYCFAFFARNLAGRGPDGPGPLTDLSGNAISSRWFGQSSLATHAVVSARNVVVVDKDLPLHLLGPLGCGIQTGAGSALIALKVGTGDTFAVFGAGAVGLSAVMAARVVGASRIIAVDLHANRLDLALELGATDVIEGSADDIARQIRKLTGGGVHAALDTTGAPQVIASAIDSLRPTGTVGLVGAATRELVLAPAALAAGKNIMGILEGDAVPQLLLPRLIELWRQDRFPFDRLIRTYPLSEITAAEADAASGATIKPVLLPHP
ncbi:NAD(P)-dependent alcohol dehydrogenase [Rhodococcus sp. IEGM 248]|nr:NAD(P)-dependent alcohol dehydrogenase [Rhodococcus sp. IEGM 248]